MRAAVRLVPDGERVCIWCIAPINQLEHPRKRFFCLFCVRGIFGVVAPSRRIVGAACMRPGRGLPRAAFAGRGTVGASAREPSPCRLVCGPHTCGPYKPAQTSLQTRKRSLTFLLICLGLLPLQTNGNIRSPFAVQYPLPGVVLDIFPYFLEILPVADHMIVIGSLPYWELGFPADACLPTAHHTGQGRPAGCG